MNYQDFFKHIFLSLFIGLIVMFGIILLFMSCEQVRIQEKILNQINAHMEANNE